MQVDLRFLHEAVSGPNIIKKLQPWETADKDKFTQKS